MADTSAMAMAMLAMQARVEQQDRIIARLTGALKLLEGRTVHELSQLFAPRRSGGQPAFAMARAARLRVK
jgi:hypothetical protein